MSSHRAARTRVPPALMALAVLGWSLAGCPPQKPTERSGSAASRSPSKGTGSARTSEGAEAVRVNGESITARQLEAVVEDLPEYVRARLRAKLDATGSRRTYLRSLAQFEVMADVAERRGLGEAPAVGEAMKRAVAERTIRAELQRRMAGEEISREAVERYYEKHGEQYHQPEERAALVIVFESKERAERVRRDLIETEADVGKQIRKFRRRAAQVSVDRRTAQEGGALGWIAPPETERKHPAVAGVVFGLDERGSVSDVFEVDDRWYIASWHDRRSEMRRELEEVAPDIRATLRERRRRRMRQKMLEEWRRQADVEIRESAIEELEAPPPRVPASLDDVPLQTVSAEEETAGGESP